MSLLVEYFSDNKFSNVPSFSIHFKVLTFYVRNLIWSFLYFTTHSRVIHSRQNVLNADFRSYKCFQSISVSIAINAKYR